MSVSDHRKCALSKEWDLPNSYDRLAPHSAQEYNVTYGAKLNAKKQFGLVKWMSNMVIQGYVVHKSNRDYNHLSEYESASSKSINSTF